MYCLCTLIQWSTLCKIPLCQEVHHIMIPTDMTFNNLTTTRVNDTRAVCVLNLSWKITKNVETSIINTHCWIVRPLLCLYCILKTSSLKSNIPILNTLHQIRNPLLWCSWVDIEYNRLNRLYELSLCVCLLIFWL